MRATRPILVTGATGFVGRHLLAALQAGAGRERPIVALGQTHEATASGPVETSPAIRWRHLDICDGAALASVVSEWNPGEVYHLAARASVAASFEDPAATFQTNAMGTLHLLEALRRHAPDAKLLVVSSAEVYGCHAGSPLREETPLAPANPYAASKAAAEFLAVAYGKAHGLAVVRARAFNHTGPGQEASFVIPSFARQIALIEAGRQPAGLSVGNLLARRDFLDVRDVVTAYLSLMATGVPGEAYNVCSGQAVSIRELLDGLVALARVGIEVVVDPARLRPIEVAELIGDPTALKALTAWQPQIPMARTMADVLAEWRARTPWLGDAISGMC